MVAAGDGIGGRCCRYRDPRDIMKESATSLSIKKDMIFLAALELAASKI